MNQVRLQPIRISNVVNYQVVVSVDNEKGELLPGMTANLEFISGNARDVLLINNSALRFRPNEEMLKEIKPTLIEKAKNIQSDSLRLEFLDAINDDESFSPVNFKKDLPAHVDGFFYNDPSGKLNFKLIEVGISSGLDSEIKRFLDKDPLKEGDKAINSIKTKTK